MHPHRLSVRRHAGPVLAAGPNVTVPPPGGGGGKYSPGTITADFTLQPAGPDPYACTKVVSVGWVSGTKTIYLAQQITKPGGYATSTLDCPNTTATQCTKTFPTFYFPCDGPYGNYVFEYWGWVVQNNVGVQGSDIQKGTVDFQGC
jgi:hypothetical protein